MKTEKEIREKGTEHKKMMDDALNKNLEIAFIYQSGVCHVLHWMLQGRKKKKTKKKGKTK